jgi:hypothetical protein
VNDHADLPTLIAYWQGELDAAHEAPFEQHYLACEICSARLAEVKAAADGVKRAFASGQVGVFLTPAFAERLRARGLRMREYHVPCNGSVNCTIALDDQVLLSRLKAPLQGVERVDAIANYKGEHRIEDVPFDPVSGEVLMAPSVATARAWPAHRQTVRLLAVGPGGDRILGEYEFNHSPPI